MVSARRRSAAAVIVAALAVTTAVFVALAVTQPPAAAETAAFLTVYTGTVDVQKSHETTFVHAQSGDQVSAGDAIRTGPETEAAITYPSGTVARLDSNTRLTITQLGRTSGGGWNIDLYQAVGKSWSRMSHLIGGSTYIVNAPNSVAAEVRGTEFEVIVEAQGVSTIVRLDVFAGVVAATANRGTVAVTAGQSTTTSLGLPPTPPYAISIADRQDSFTVFNVTADAARGRPVSVDNGRLVTTQATGEVAGATGDGTSDLQFTLGWPGSRFELTVFDPAGSVYAQVISGSSPVMIVVADAQTGLWSYQVTDIESKPGEVWWVIVGVIPDATATPRAGSSSSAPPAALAPAGPGSARGAATSQPASAVSSQPLSAPPSAAVTPILAPVTPVVAAVSGPVAPVAAAVAPIPAPVTPVVAAVAPALAPVAPVLAVASPILAPVATLAPLLPPIPPPPSPATAPPSPPPPPPPPPPAGLLGGLAGVIKSTVL